MRVFNHTLQNSNAYRSLITQLLFNLSNYKAHVPHTSSEKHKIQLEIYITI
jgi:hypothetical protein